MQSSSWSVLPSACCWGCRMNTPRRTAVRRDDGGKCANLPLDLARQRGVRMAETITGSRGSIMLQYVLYLGWQVQSMIASAGRGETESDERVKRWSGGGGVYDGNGDDYGGKNKIR
jgi:hypothetical protein